MPGFDFVAVGGTGECVLLELGFRHARDVTSPLPEKVWVVDPDVTHNTDLQTLIGQEKIQWATVGGGGEHVGNLAGAFGRITGSDSTAVARFLRAGFTGTEMNLSVEKGFFALPRVAASWVALGDLDPVPGFLDKQYLETAAGNTLVIAGSLGGGTGAGLLPTLLHRVRKGGPDHWRRKVLVVPVLPWFNPSHASGPQWDDCLWNAQGGVLELCRISEGLTRQLVESDKTRSPQVAETHIAFVGPRYKAEDTPPPNYEAVKKAGFFGGVVSDTADLVLTLTSPRQTAGTAAVEVGPRVVVGFGALPVVHTDPFSASAATASGGPNTAHSGPKNPCVAVRLKVLRDELKARREHYYGLVGGRMNPCRDFERVVGGVINRSRELSGVNRAEFWRSFDEALDATVKALDGGVCTGLARAQDLDETLGQIDDGLKAGMDLKSLLDHVDTTQPGKEAFIVCNAIVDRLLSAEEIARRSDIQSAQAKGAAFKPILPDGSTAVAGLPVPAPVERNQALLAALPPGVTGAGAATHYDTQMVKAVAGSLVAGKAGFHGSSWARLMGHAHMVRSYLENPVNQATRLSLQKSALILWKAAAMGLLQYDVLKPAVEDRNKSWFESESFDTDFGPELVSLSFNGTCLGQLSADAGLIPHADIVDIKASKPAENSYTPVFAQLTAAVQAAAAALNVNLDALLKDFARQTSDVAPDPKLPWIKILGSSTDQRAACLNRLNAVSVPSKGLFLRVSLGGQPARVSMPLVLGSETKEALSYVVKAEKFTTVLEIANQEVRFKKDKVKVASLESLGGEFHVTGVDIPMLQAAKNLIPKPRSSGSPVLIDFK